jgi:hypothetical protein
LVELGEYIWIDYNCLLIRELVVAHSLQSLLIQKTRRLVELATLALEIQNEDISIDGDYCLLSILEGVFLDQDIQLGQQQVVGVD